ncbi:MAG TPA: class F sortase [Candidatus Eisenbacteria bacterium]|nr:class F sortase [Candidatus Eisenbacteria bacterium]
MRRKKLPYQRTIRTLEAVAILLAAFDVLIWHGVLSDGASAPAAAVSIAEPAHVQVPPAPSAPPETVAPQGVGLPLRIEIPSIAVDAAIEHVATAADGSMDVPKDPLDTGWYSLGTRPGDPGSAAIAGHVDWKQGATGVFAALRKVKTGDAIRVLDDRGSVISFTVREVRKYDPAADATDVFTSSDGRSHLALITCAGKWNARAKQYSERLVVFADKGTE